MEKIQTGAKFNRAKNNDPRSVILQGGMELWINDANLELYRNFDFCDRCIHNEKNNEDICCECIIPYLSVMIYK